VRAVKVYSEGEKTTLLQGWKGSSRRFSQKEDAAFNERHNVPSSRSRWKKNKFSLKRKIVHAMEAKITC
jgi:hypothetical protein